MALIGTLIALGLWKRDASLASPTDRSDWIRAERWQPIRGSALTPVTGEGWAPIRSTR